MQAYVHKDGKTLGPYTVRELKERVEEGVLIPDDQASYDGQNWVKISQVPGFDSSIPPPPPRPPPPQYAARHPDRRFWDVRPRQAAAIPL